VTKWWLTGTRINTFNSSHLSEKEKFKYRLKSSIYFTYVKVHAIHDVTHTQLSKMPHTHTHKRRKRMYELSSSLVGYMRAVLFFSLCLSLVRSFSSLFLLCTITICKVILSNWHEIKTGERERREERRFQSISICGIVLYYKPSHTRTNELINYLNFCLVFVWIKANILL
jgi:hypothetical protein